MPIHYRCRCGQEVVLRPREGVYIVIGALVGLTLLNTALLIFLTDALGDRPPPPRHAAERPGEGTAPAPPRDGDPASPVDGAPGAAADPDLPSSPATEPPPAGRPARGTEIGAAIGEGSRTGALAGPDADASPLAPAPRESPGAHAATPEFAEVALAIPDGLDPARLPLLLDAAAPGSLDRTLVLLAACRWGGALAPRASDLLRVEAPLLFESIVVVDPGSAELRLRAPGAGSARGQLAALAQVWQSRWDQILARIAADPRLEWGRALADAGGSAPVDLVLLVDLSESMAPEVASAAAALRSMLPVLLGARPGWRVGWIGYRDEVHDRLPLTADAAALVDSLERWRAEGGGDVPEGLDEALFEAFRLGAFSWRPEAEHRFVVLGDAPPPYERIEEMVDLARAAHAAPERFAVHCLGIVREEGFAEVPGFRALAGAAGGDCDFIREGIDPAPPLWRLIAGKGAPPWSETESRRP